MTKTRNRTESIAAQDAHAESPQVDLFWRLLTHDRPNDQMVGKEFSRESRTCRKGTCERESKGAPKGAKRRSITNPSDYEVKPNQSPGTNRSRAMM